jgi:TIR domain-containing protein
MPQRKTVFVSYSHQNKRWLKRLQVHLAPYQRSGIDIWDDTKIAPGQNWRAEIQNAIDRAVASIVLISPDFLASDFVHVYELPTLLRRAKQDGAAIMPLFVEHCELKPYPDLAGFQGFNSPNEPLGAIARAEAELVLRSVSTTIGQLLPSVPHEADADSKIFDELQNASIGFAVLWVLSVPNTALTISELEKTLQIRSRKRAFEAVERFVAEGWIEKTKAAGLTKYRLKQEGARQLQRLASASDGPVRRATITPR